MGDGIASVHLALGVQDAPERLAASLREAGLDVELGAGGTVPRVEGLDVAVVELAALATGAWADAAQRNPDLELVAVTRAEELAAGVRALRLGASDLLVSPIEPPALLHAVARATDRSRARAAARDARELARWAELGRLAAGLMHELANPVAVVLSAASALERTVEHADQAGRPGAPRVLPAPAFDGLRDAAREALAGADRLKTLARDLRTVLRADPSALGPVDVAATVQLALRVGRAEIAAHAQVTVDVPPGLAAVASQGALAEALVHVLGRAARAIVASGQRRAPVRVQAREEGEAVVIAIEDGIPPPPPDPALRHLGLRLPPGLAPGPGAHGLAVARELVERQGGACSGRATLDGTVVEITLRAPALPRTAP